MKISVHFNVKRLSFSAKLPNGQVIERFVYSFLAHGEKTYLIDTGVNSSLTQVKEMVDEIDEEHRQVSEILITHAHPDHIGGLLSAQKEFQCPVAAGADSIPWIEDIDLQYKQRPAPGFYGLVESSVKVDRALSSEDVIDLGDGTSMTVLEIPGHADGQIGFYHKADGVIITADSVPVSGQLPIYDDVIKSVNTIKMLRSIPDLKVMLSSWDDPRYGNEIYEILDSGLEYIEEIHNAVKLSCEEYGKDDLENIAHAVHRIIGLKPSDYNPLYVRTIAAHIDVLDEML